MIDKAPVPVKLICAVTFAPSVDIENILTALENTFGIIESKSEIINFNHTDYYDSEMGTDLQKMLVSFERLFKPQDLWLAKLTTIDIEKIFKKNGKRRINLDPGYLETSKLVLASTKNFSHRIYLNEGIWAEVALIYSGQQFQKLPWTYPDYMDIKFIKFLEATREKYRLFIR
ncbi:MAG: DUF4416 family protein [candidate division Zixibacteria bacterium]|nr:DUF4416 family protein [candidate division Zixibacteria bacterium]